MNLFLAALVVSVCAYVFSYLWFGPVLFSSLYMRNLEKSNRAEQHPRLLVFGLFFLILYVALVTLGYFVYRHPERGFGDGARLGLYLWVFYVAVEFGNTLFNRVNMVVQSIAWAYWLIVAVVGGGSLALLSRIPWPF